MCADDSLFLSLFGGHCVKGHWQLTEAREQNSSRPKGSRAGPRRSSDGSQVGPDSQIGPFRIERELGRGAVGVVYLAHDTKLGRPVAIKSLPAGVMEKPGVRSRFSR